MRYPGGLISLPLVLNNPLPLPLPFGDDCTGEELKELYEPVVELCGLVVEELPLEEFEDELEGLAEVLEDCELEGPGELVAFP